MKTSGHFVGNKEHCFGKAEDDFPTPNYSIHSYACTLTHTSIYKGVFLLVTRAAASLRLRICLVTAQDWGVNMLSKAPVLSQPEGKGKQEDSCE